MIDIKKSIGKRIQEIRKSRKMTQEQLALMIGIEPQSLSYIETGKFSPSTETLQSLAHALNVNPWEFYYFDDVSEDEMKKTIHNAIENNKNTLKIMYYFFKSIEY